MPVIALPVTDPPAARIMPNPENSSLPADFASNAAYPLFRLDLRAQQAQVLEFLPEDYRRAAFLDERALGQRPIAGANFPLQQLHQHLLHRPGNPVAMHWLFHIGHCGSTLVSRLLDQQPGVLGLREPLPLLELAAIRMEVEDPALRFDRAVYRSALNLVLALLARGFADTRAVLVKPTSVVLNLADDILSMQPPSQAAFLWIDLESWLCLMLRSPDLCLAARQQAPARIRDWQRFSGDDAAIAALTDPELLAMSWLVEQLRWTELCRRPEMTERLLALNFDTFLADPRAGLTRLLAHYRLPVDNAHIEAALDSGLMSVYSKDARQVFDGSMRESEIREAGSRFQHEVRAGMDWAARALTGMGHPELPGTLHRLA